MWDKVGMIAHVGQGGQNFHGHIIVPTIQLRAEKALQQREMDRLLTQALSEKEATLTELEKRLAKEAKYFFFA